MKSTQTGTGSSRKESGYSQMNSQQQLSNSQSNSGSPGQSSGALANYTLPGVISYLTSEFTNLERFKILTNLEKSEMNYRIQQLTSELNSVRFLNEKQALRIRFLEQQLEQTKHDKIGEDKESNIETNEANSVVSKEENGEPEAVSKSKREDRNGSERQAQNSQSPSTDPATNTEIPHVDLDFLRDSRKKLNRSIREIVNLLEPPTGIDFLEAHSGAPTHSEFEDLLDESNHFTFDPGHENRTQPRESVFARYTLGKDDLVSEQKISFEDEAKQPGGADNEKPEESKSWNEVRQFASENFPSKDESDTETVTMDEPDLIGILSNGTDAKKTVSA